MTAGRTKKQKAEVARVITDAMVDIMKATREKTVVIFQDVTKDDYSIGGTLLSDQ